ncbi:MAG: hypothetical protein WAW61_05430, partial [Methylococcaceae bacterium]
LPDNYVKMDFISINLGTGKQMPTTGYSDPFEKDKDFKWTIFWKSGNGALLRKKWRHEVSFNNWKTEEYYYELIIYEKEVIVNKLRYVPDKNMKVVDIYSEQNDFEFFSDHSSIDRNDLATRHPEMLFKETWWGNLKVYYKDSLVSKHKKRFVINIFTPTFQKPGFNGLAISPDNRYIFYGISWSGSFWNVGPNHLYLLDIEKKNVTLIDEHYNSNTPELMLWSMDSKKFVYRRNNEINHSRELGLITFQR